MMKAPCLAAAVLLLCGLAKAANHDDMWRGLVAPKVAGNYHMMSPVASFADAEAGCSAAGGDLVRDTEVLMKMAQDHDVSLWVGSAPSMRTFGRCKMMNAAGSVMAGSCSVTKPMAYVCLVDDGTAPDEPRVLEKSDPMYREISGLFVEWNRRAGEGSAKNWVDDEQDIRRTWGDADLPNGNSLIDLYHEKATLLPTVSAEARMTRAAIQDYFDGSGIQRTVNPDPDHSSFLSKDPEGKIIEGERVIKALGSDIAIDQGTYIFTLNTGARKADGTFDRAEALARYTLVYRKDKEGNWKIFVHHSSEVPVYSAENGLAEVLLNNWFKALRSNLHTDFDGAGNCADVSPAECVGDLAVRAQGISELYAPDAVLLATVSPKVNIGRRDIRDYMMYFSGLNPFGQISQDNGNDIKITILGPNTISYAGVYNFQHPANAPAGERDRVSARFSFTFVRNEAGKWLITEHHSSALPMGRQENGQTIGDNARISGKDDLQPIDFNNVGTSLA